MNIHEVIFIVSGGGLLFITMLKLYNVLKGTKIIEDLKDMVLFFALSILSYIGLTISFLSYGTSLEAIHISLYYLMQVVYYLNWVFFIIEIIMYYKNIGFGNKRYTPTK